MSYDASKITVLKGLEAVRKRPGMYIGDLTEAYRRMILEVVDNSVDESMAGHCDSIEIIINGSICSVKDNGRGIPVDKHPTGQSALEVIMTTLHAGGKFSDESYDYSGGLHGVGVSVTNALSEWLEVEVYKDGKIYWMRFEKGITVSELKIIGETKEKGTKVSFSPDFSIVEEKELNIGALRNFLKELSLLNQGLKITLDFNNNKEEFLSSSLKDFFENKFLHEPILIENNQLKICFGWTENRRENITCFTNNIKQTEGGTHLSGLKSAITRTFTNYFNSNVKKTMNLQSEDIHNGLLGILSLRLKEPKSLEFQDHE